MRIDLVNLTAAWDFTKDQLASSKTVQLIAALALFVFSVAVTLYCKSLKDRVNPLPPPQPPLRRREQLPVREVEHKKLVPSHMPHRLFEEKHAELERRYPLYKTYGALACLPIEIIAHISTFLSLADWQRVVLVSKGFFAFKNVELNLLHDNLSLQDTAAWGNPTRVFTAHLKRIPIYRDSVLRNQFLLNLIHVPFRDLSSNFILKNLLVLREIKDLRILRLGLLKLITELRLGRKLTQQEMIGYNNQKVELATMARFIHRLTVTFNFVSKNEILNILEQKWNFRCNLSEASYQGHPHDRLTPEVIKDLLEKCFNAEPELANLYLQDAWPNYPKQNLPPALYQQELVSLKDNFSLLRRSL